MHRPRTDLLIAFAAWLTGSMLAVLVGGAVSAAAGWDPAAIAAAGADVGRTSLQVASGVAASTTVVPLWASVFFQIPLWAAMFGGPRIAASSWGEVKRRYGLRLVPADVGLGLVAGIGTQLLVLPALYWVLFSVFGDADVGAPARELAARATDPVGVVAFVVLVVVMAPLAEELFYRGLVQSTLARMMPAFAAVPLAAAIFAAVHFQPLQFPGLFTFGLVLGELYRRRRTLGAPIVAHAAFNATTVVTLLT